MSDYERFEHLFSQAESGTRGKYWSKLDKVDQELIQDFLDNSDLSDKSKQSYKSYLSKALVEPETLSRDQKSAIKKFGAWLKNR